MPRAYRNPKQRATDIPSASKPEGVESEPSDDGSQFDPGSDHSQQPQKKRLPVGKRSTNPRKSSVKDAAEKQKQNDPTETPLSTPAPSNAIGGVPPTGGSQWQSSRQKYALPTPSQHHRHRATPLFSHPEKAERLVSSPELFCRPEIATTNSFTRSEAISNRLGKVWGYNVGPGPLWEVIEDRAWFKESISTGLNPEKEENRRPMVYTEVRVNPNLEILSEEYV